MKHAARHFYPVTLALSLATLLACATARADSPVIATSGCAQFHCNLEATGVMYDNILDFHGASSLSITGNSDAGTLRYGGCSGDGVRLACLFVSDNVTAGVTKGTLKMVAPTGQLAPIWGSAGVPGSYDIDASEFLGQVPVVYADGRVSAGDAHNYVLYSATGAAEKMIPLNGRGKNMGMTPISDQYGVISQSTGLLTLIDRINWVKVFDVPLKDGSTVVTLVSPSTGANGVLYAVGIGTGAKSNVGYLYPVDLVLNQGAPRLRVRAPFVFTGQTGASVVVGKPAVTGFAHNLLLLHVRGLPDDPAPQDRLMGLLDTGSGGIVPAWPQPITLPSRMKFSPGIDEVSRSLFFQLATGSVVYQHQLTTGNAVTQFDMRSIGGFPAGFGLNGHILSNQANGVFTLFLSGSFSGSRRDPNNGQYVMGFQPLAAPGNLRWLAKIGKTADSITQAWTIGPSNHVPGAYCPIVVGDTSGITKICDR